MGKLKKDYFSQFAEFECDRQLFINLSQENENWMVEGRKIKPLERTRFSSKLTELGKIYEKQVYNYLLKISNTISRLDLNKEVTKSALPPQKLEDLHEHAMKKPLCLLEHEYEIPQSYVNSIVGTDTGDAQNKLRPDIILLFKEDLDENEYTRTIDIQGNILELSPAQIMNRIAINIIDIKATSEDSINKRHYIEILYYLFSLNSLLYENQLDDKYYVKLDGNGIFPNSEDLFLRDLDDINNFKIELPYDDTSRIFTQTIMKIRKLGQNRPKLPEQVELRIQPICGRCDYLEDCKSTLNYDKKPSEWKVELIPYTSPSIAQQLKDYGMETIGEVVSDLDSIEFGNSPEPLYTELPLLKLKSRAIIEDTEVVPNENDVFSVAIPKFSDMNLIINAEADPIFNRIYAFGFYLNMSTAPNSAYNESFFRWWQIWKDYLDDIITLEEAISDINMDFEINLSEFFAKRFSKALRELTRLTDVENQIFEIKLPGDKTGNDKTVENTYVNIGFSTVNTGLEPREEQHLAQSIVEMLGYVMTICEIIEYHIKVYDQKKEYTYGPLLAIYYWSQEIIQAIQDMLQRNLKFLLLNPDINREFSRLVRWFSPSESSPQHPNHFKKVYDLRKFVETTLGFPTAINYTWHEIAEKRFNYTRNSKYWTPNFNYMDFQTWHDYLSEQNIDEKTRKMMELRRQIMIKLRMLSALRIEFQSKSRALISLKVRPLKDSLLSPIALPSRYHALAQMWYMFSTLTDTVDEIESIEKRTMYPEYSIGKMEVARVSDLKQYDHPTLKRFRYSFKLTGMSTNMKISERSSVLLLPFELRDQNFYPRKWEVTIDRIQWNNEDESYSVYTTYSYLNTQENLEEEGITNPEWYLYPNTMSAWTNKLKSGSNGLLQRYNFGESWLARRIASMWDIDLVSEVNYPDSLEFNTHESYMYAPDLIGKIRLNNIQELRTKIYPLPDTSQQSAIIRSLNHVMTVIQGPPGTGKSQTIVALIDEFLARFEGNAKILITSFSYPAMEVILDKLIKSRDDQGNPTKATELQKIFLRSQFRDELVIEDTAGYAKIHDFYRQSTRNWKFDGDTITPKNSRSFDDYINGSFVLFSNAHQLYHLREKDKQGNLFLFHEELYFDLIIIDEASQLPTDYLLSSMQYVKPGIIEYSFGTPIYDKEVNLTEEELSSLNLLSHPDVMTQVVIVGDQRQLPPVQPVKPPMRLKMVLGGLFEYLVSEEGHNIIPVQLETNYRSNQDIVNYTAQLGFYQNLQAFVSNASSKIQGVLSEDTDDWIKVVMNPNKIVSTLIHDNRYELAVSKLEAEICVDLIIAYYQMVDPKTKAEQESFWQEEIGIVAPHNAQGRLIIRDVFQKIQQQNDQKLSPAELMNALQNTIYSVEKFQGSDRQFIIASIAISSTDQLTSEEEFIYDLTRFNVLTSRAKSKIVLVCSRNFLDYMPHDPKILEYASKIRSYAMKFCNKSSNLSIGDQKVEFRYHQS